MTLEPLKTIGDYPASYDTTEEASDKLNAWLASYQQSVRSVMDYGAAGDGVTDDTAAIQACIDTFGRAYLPAGTYLYSTLNLGSTGDGIIGAGHGKTILKGTTGITVTAGVTDLLLQGFRLEPQTPVTTGHDNSRSYLDATAIDLTGAKRSVVRDIYSYKWQTHLNLGFSASQTYYNHVENLQTWGGETGVIVGGDASAHDGANANVFVGCSFMACSKAIILRGGYNNFLGTHIENPLTDAGYPAAVTAVWLESGYDAVGNTFLGTYVELAGTSNTCIRFEYVGPGYITPNVFIGGSWYGNYHETNNPSGTMTPSFDDDVDLTSSALGCTFDAPGIRPTRRYIHDLNGNYVSRYYDNVGGVITQHYTGSAAATIAHETYGTAAPTTGTWIRGAHCWNTTPSAAGYAGWICVTAGTPGTWLGFSAIAAS